MCYDICVEPMYLCKIKFKDLDKFVCFKHFKYVNRSPVSGILIDADRLWIKYTRLQSFSNLYLLQQSYSTVSAITHDQEIRYWLEVEHLNWLKNQIACVTDPPLHTCIAPRHSTKLRLGIPNQTITRFGPYHIHPITNQTIPNNKNVD